MSTAYEDLAKALLPPTARDAINALDKANDINSSNTDHDNEVFNGRAEPKIDTQINEPKSSKASKVIGV